MSQIQDMQPGKIVLIDLPQADGMYKLRPALILKQLPKYDDFLVCGISSQLNQYLPGIDEILEENDPHFTATGLHKASVIRLLFLAVVPNNKIAGGIGQIIFPLHKELLRRLANFLTS